VTLGKGECQGASRRWSPSGKGDRQSLHQPRSIPQHPSKAVMEASPEPGLEIYSPVTPSVTDTVMAKHLNWNYFSSLRKRPMEKLASPLKKYMDQT